MRAWLPPSAEISNPCLREAKAAGIQSLPGLVCYGVCTGLVTESYLSFSSYNGRFQMRRHVRFDPADLFVRYSATVFNTAMLGPSTKDTTYELVCNT